MTFISVGIMKVEESSARAKYAFGDPPGRVLGHVVIHKADGKIELLDITDEKYRHLLPFIKKRLVELHELGEYPENTHYHA